jgi:hypothetical protein
LLVIHKLGFLLFLCWVWFWIQKRVEFVMSFLFKRHSDYVLLLMRWVWNWILMLNL